MAFTGSGMATSVCMHNYDNNPKKEQQMMAKPTSTWTSQMTEMTSHAQAEYVLQRQPNETRSTVTHYATQLGGYNSLLQRLCGKIDYHGMLHITRHPLQVFAKVQG